MQLNPRPQRAYQTKPPEPMHFVPIPRPAAPPRWLIRLLFVYSLVYWVAVSWMITHS